MKLYKCSKCGAEFNDFVDYEIHSIDCDRNYLNVGREEEIDLLEMIDEIDSYDLESY